MEKSLQEIPGLELAAYIQVQHNILISLQLVQVYLQNWEVLPLLIDYYGFIYHKLNVKLPPLIVPSLLQTVLILVSFQR